VKVLFVCHRLPFPPRRGGKIRPFNVIRHLSQRHDVTVASLARTTEELEAGAGLRNYCSNVIAETISAPAALARMVARLPTATPSSMGYFYSPALAKQITAEVARAKFDLIFVHCAFVAGYVADVTSAKKLLDFGDMDSQKWLAYAKNRAFPMSLGYYLDGTKLRRAEARLARKFDVCTCTTRAELEVLNSYGTGVPADWFPNGVDTEYFKPAEAPYRPDSVCFVGRMDYYPNQEGVIDFCRDVLPLIRARRPGVTLEIVGAEPPAKIRELGRLPGVTVTGSVPDVRPYAHAAAVAIAPLKIARGTQNKILEAMAMAVPTVASTVAAGGVDAEPGRHLLTASSPPAFADAVLRLLENPAERTRLAEAARARVLSHHSWKHSMERVDRLIEEHCLPGSGRAPAKPKGGPFRANR
jgi:sugar transferase (PEP-CTERM/EpsH1 system associated)